MNWNTANRFIIALLDEGEDIRTENELNAFIEEIHLLGENYGFVLDQWGKEDLFCNLKQD